MSHLPYKRQVIIANNVSLDSLVPRNLELNSFAVFCGDLSQRLNTALHCISRYIGEIGIVVIHDTDTINSRLSTAISSSNRQNVQFRTNTSKIYDPLYGMGPNAILDLLAPIDSANPVSRGVDTLRLGITNYLKIMNHKFHEHSAPFGKYPYNLDLLYELCNMPITVLKSSVLNHMPALVAKPIASVLDAPDMQKNVLACVENLTNMMSEHLWENKGFAGHTGISIIDSVTNRGVISIRVPNSNAGILNYINVELDTLHNRNIPFLLVNCGVDISQNTAMQGWFLREHEGSKYYTAIITSLLSSIGCQSDSVGKIFAQYDQIFVLKCSGNDAAEPFSSQFGEYRRKEIEVANGTVRRFWGIFPSFQSNKTIKYIIERNIKPEDLTDPGHGVLLCGKAYSLPILINHLI